MKRTTKKAAKAAAKTQRSPREARTDKQMIELTRDNISVGGWWFMIDGDVVILTAQKSGESPTQQVTVPRGVFGRVVDWYNKPQPIVPRTRPSPQSRGH